MARDLMVRDRASLSHLVLSFFAVALDPWAAFLLLPLLFACGCRLLLRLLRSGCVLRMLAASVMPPCNCCLASAARAAVLIIIIIVRR